MPLKYIYVAGPYTKGDVAVNTRQAILAGETLIANGFVPFVPHLSHFWHFVCPHPADYWYQYDLEWLKQCDALLLLPGESNGAQNEVKVMISWGCQVYHSVDGLLEARDALCKKV